MVTLGRRDQKKIETKRRIAEVAVQLLREVGEEKTTISAIVDRADVSQRTFYNYFSNREEAIFYFVERLPHAIAKMIQASPQNKKTVELLEMLAIEIINEPQESSVSIHTLVVVLQHLEHYSVADYIQCRGEDKGEELSEHEKVPENTLDFFLPVIDALQEYSGNKLTRFEAFILGQTFVMVMKSVIEAHDSLLFDDLGSVQEMVHEGFKILSRGLGTLA
ncbi:TetR/AcrR family transcriptional regulator [Corynebacterium sp. sy017]|uniref:TetR/AcrR family transcriptional regulator n=1 Tax=unclassified Corynebacterium TaxID=2624378 RepID=UPI00118668AA|nr:MULTISPECIES: TetR/AcrR family transcriptional regulator [unclassified Corynebacterium]MBP3088358.1 TetR/AcrR family transcriptional regulator [Corynebacterium sp. sy017]TSD91674.1 TetR/AcrR family transcriptional regulator [Corynebacterium sp. SY003]